MKKTKGKAIAGSVLKRVFNPVHIAVAAKRGFTSKAAPRSRDDAELNFYARALPTEFLHYGFFDDVNRRPEDVSLSEIAHAQNRYADMVLEHVWDRGLPVLDIGCGMGGLSRILVARGFSPVALTPNRTQAAHIRRTLSEVPVIESKFEDLSPAEHRHRFGTLITAESLQYLKLDRALPLMEEVIRPGGRWVACDYFRIAQAHEKSGHNWSDFVPALAARGWRIVYERDITANVLPTLRLIHMWANRLGVPLLDLLAARMRRKQPALHYMLEEGLGMWRDVLADKIEVLNPETFARQKKYMLLVMEYAGK